jgi:hypothetical protein
MGYSRPAGVAVMSRAEFWMQGAMCVIFVVLIIIAVHQL